MSHIATRKPGTLRYLVDGEVHQVKVNAVVINQGVFVAECVGLETSLDGAEKQTEFDIMLPISSMIMYESEQ